VAPRPPAPRRASARGARAPSRARAGPGQRPPRNTHRRRRCGQTGEVRPGQRVLARPTVSARLEIPDRAVVLAPPGVRSPRPEPVDPRVKLEPCPAWMATRTSASRAASGRSRSRSGVRYSATAGSHPEPHVPPGRFLRDGGGAGRLDVGRALRLRPGPPARPADHGAGAAQRRQRQHRPALAGLRGGRHRAAAKRRWLADWANGSAGHPAASSTSATSTARGAPRCTPRGGSPWAPRTSTSTSFAARETAAWILVLDTETICC
jgi:hypothetical protein